MPETSLSASSSKDEGTEGKTGATNGQARRPTEPDMEEHNFSNDRGAKQNPPARSSILSKIKSIWTAAGIDRRTYQMMFKSAIAPTISLAAFQGDGWADFFTTLGYLTIIMTILPVVIMPRAKFLQTMLTNVLFVCLGCSLSLLSIFCMVKARSNSVGEQGPGTGGAGTSGTAAPGAQTSTYNSSASAVAGVWLFVQIFMISALRAKMPQYNVPCIIWAVFTNVAMVYGPQFSTMAQAESFALRLIYGFLTGFAIATGVSLFIFPLTSREVVFKGMTGYIASLRGALQANLEYMHSLEDDDPFTAARTNTLGDHLPKSEKAKAFKQKLAGLGALHAKVSTDLPFAKREVAFGKLGPDDLQETFRLLRLIMIPTVGLSCLADIFGRLADERGWDRHVDLATATVSDASNPDEKIRITTIQEWHELMKLLREPLNNITQTIDNGLEHVAITLELVPRPKNRDLEAEGGEPQPGDDGFAACFAQRRLDFLNSKEVMLRGWCALHDIHLPDDFFENDEADLGVPDWMQEGSLSEPHGQLRRQLYLCLYMEFLLVSISRRVLHLVVAADTLKAHGKLSKTRLIVPGAKRMRKWFTSLFNNEEDSTDELNTDGNANTVFLGSAYSTRRDAEHLPPANAWERFGDQLRRIAHFFQSPASTFGFRVACATMSIAIIGLLRPTQMFFTEQRLFWAQIMVSIAMSPTTGQSLRNFFLRAGGTCIAMLLSFIAWYIVDGKTAGVIVMFFIFMHPFAWLKLKKPAYIPVGMIGQITMSLILGYELQVRTLGVAVATSNGQAYYPIYQLGPIRLATVLAGLSVGWVFSWFPYPVSEAGQVRRQLGSALYLLANYYSCMHETLRLRLRNELGDMDKKDSPGRKLEKARNKLYSKTTLTINALRAQAGFLKFDIPIGGRFPRVQYQRLINHLQSILNFMSLVSVSSQSFSDLQNDYGNGNGDSNMLKWLSGFQKLVGQANYTSEQVTSLLALLSASVMTEQALPPYLQIPQFGLSQKLYELDHDILSLRHIAEPGYASFAVVQIGTKYIHDDLKMLVEGIKEIVGELDFSYHIVSTGDAKRNESQETLLLRKGQSQEERDGLIKRD